MSPMNTAPKVAQELSSCKHASASPFHCFLSTHLVCIQVLDCIEALPHPQRASLVDPDPEHIATDPELSSSRTSQPALLDTDSKDSGSMNDLEAFRLSLYGC